MSKDPVDILLVEDDPNDVELALIALRKNNLAINIQVARDGEEALNFLLGRGQHAGRNPADAPRLILLDLKLPKVTGKEVLQELKKNPITRPIPVAVLTSSKQLKDMRECYLFGANSYIQKPIDFEQFQRAMHDVGHYWLTVNQSLPPEAQTP